MSRPRIWCRPLLRGRQVEGSAATWRRPVAVRSSSGEVMSAKRSQAIGWEVKRESGACSGPTTTSSSAVAGLSRNSPMREQDSYTLTPG